MRGKCIFCQFLVRKIWKNGIFVLSLHKISNEGILAEKNLFRTFMISLYSAQGMPYGVDMA